jgi:hypothetical protein
MIKLRYGLSLGELSQSMPLSDSQFLVGLELVMVIVPIPVLSRETSSSTLHSQRVLPLISSQPTTLLAIDGIYTLSLTKSTVMKSAAFKLQCPILLLLVGSTPSVPLRTLSRLGDSLLSSRRAG